MAPKRAVPLIFSVLASAIGGLLFHLLQLPLPWILGPALGIMLLRAWRVDLAYWPRLFGETGILLVSYSLGSKMMEEAAGLIVTQLHWMLLLGMFWLGLCLTSGMLIAKWGKLDRTSALLGSVPGGLAQMVMMADEFKGSDVSVVAVLQTARLIVVLYSVPVIAAWLSTGSAGADIVQAVVVPFAWDSVWTYVMLALVPASIWAARAIKMPAGELLGPMLFVSICSMLGYAWGSLPDGLVAGGQLMFGTYLGSRIQLRILLANRRLGPIAVGSAVLLMLIAMTLAWIVSRLTEDSIVTWLLAFAPGGLGEVSVTALVLHANIAIVITYQMVRMFFVLLMAKPVIRWLARGSQGQVDR